MLKAKINIIKLASIIFLLFALNSCKENNNNQFSGKITDFISGNSISDVNIILESNRISAGSVNTSYTRIGEFKSDSDGRYLFLYEAIPAVSYKMIFSKTGYLEKTIEFPATDHIATYTRDEQIAAASFLKLRVRNIYPYNQYDKIRIRITGLHNEVCDYCCHNEFREFSGTNINEYISCNIVGGDSIHIMSITERVWMGQPKIDEYTLYAPVNDTLVFNLDY
jgi:hypothetical protein